MNSYKIQAIVLKSIEIKEFDRMYFVFSRERGLMRVLGIGTRKLKAKLASGLEPVTRSEIFCVGGRQTDRVTGVIIHDQYQALKKELDGILLVRKLLNTLTQILPEDESQEEVFDAVEIFLQKTNELCARKDLEEKEKLNTIIFLRAMVLWKIIKNTGYVPRLFYCSDCGKKMLRAKKHKFVFPVGVICENCISHCGDRALFLSEECVKLLRVFIQKDISTIVRIKAEPKAIQDINGISILFLEHCFGKKMNL